MKPNYPSCTFQSDNKTLNQSMITSFASALRSLFKEEKNKQRIIPDWEENFICGFVAAHLATDWFSCYIYTETEIYRQLMLLKALTLYMSHDRLATLRIEKIYQYIINQKIELSEKTNQESKLAFKVISFSEFKDKKSKKQSDDSFYQLISDYLGSIILEKHNLEFDKLLEDNYLPCLENYLDLKEISGLIDFAKREKTLSS